SSQHLWLIDDVGLAGGLPSILHEPFRQGARDLFQLSFRVGGRVERQPAVLLIVREEVRLRRREADRNHGIIAEALLELVALKLRPDAGRIVGAEECHDVASFGLIDRREIVLDVPRYDSMLLVLIKERGDLALREHLVEPPSVRSIGACKRQGEVILADEVVRLEAHLASEGAPDEVLEVEDQLGVLYTEDGRGRLKVKVRLKDRSLVVPQECLQIALIENLTNARPVLGAAPQRVGQIER